MKGQKKESLSLIEYLRWKIEEIENETMCNGKALKNCMGKVGKCRQKTQEVFQKVLGKKKKKKSKKKVTKSEIQK